MEQELFITKSPLPLMGVPITVAEYFNNTPPEEIEGIKIYYMREDGTLPENKIFYIAAENGIMNFFEILDMKEDCKINGKTLYKRFFITPVYAMAKMTDGDAF